MRTRPPKVEEDEESTKGRKKLKKNAKFQVLDYDDVIVRVGSCLQSGDILVNKICPVLPPNYKNELLTNEKVKEWRNVKNLFYFYL